LISKAIAHGVEFRFSLEFTARGHLGALVLYTLTHIDWNIDMVAPSNWALIVTTKEPNHMTTNTVVKTWEVCFAGAFDDSISARDKHMSSGPLVRLMCEFSFDTIYDMTIVIFVRRINVRIHGAICQKRKWRR
jgi:hypothetical protein